MRRALLTVVDGDPATLKYRVDLLSLDSMTPKLGLGRRRDIEGNDLEPCHCVPSEYPMTRRTDPSSVTHAAGSTRGATSVASNSSVSVSMLSTWTTKYCMPESAMAR